MPKIIVMMDGDILEEVPLTKDRTMIGRRPYSDVVIENRTVSGQHVALNKAGNEVTVEDLGSTNGTYIDGKAVKQQVLRDGDILEIGSYKIRFESESLGGQLEKPMLIEPIVPKGTIAGAQAGAATAQLNGMIKVLSGPAAGREMVLTKIVTTVGKPGVSVAAITRSQSNFLVHHVDGSDRLTLNGVTVGDESSVLKHGDRIALAGTEMEFLQS